MGHRLQPSWASWLVGLIMSLAVSVGTAGAGIISIDPADNATLTGASQVISWTGTGNITQYWLNVGTAPTALDILDSGSLGTALSTTVSGLPTDGSTVYVRLWHFEEGVWLSTDFTYTAFNDGVAGGGLSAVPPWDKVIPTAQRFVLVMGGAAVLDKETGLVWEQSPLTSTHEWSNARFQCTGRTVGGKKGWRLPSVHEQASLVDPANTNPSLPTDHPFSGQSNLYWSATTDATNPSNAWALILDNGAVAIGIKTITNSVWCVRGGGPLSEY